MLSRCIWFLYICEPVRTRTLHRLPVWQVIANNGGAEVAVLLNKYCGLPGWNGSIPWEHPEPCVILPKNVVSAFKSECPKRAEPRWLIWCRGDWWNPDLFGATFWFIPKCDTLALGVCGSGFIGCDFSGGKPGAYLCLFVFQCCNLPSSLVSLFY